MRRAGNRERRIDNRHGNNAPRGIPTFMKRLGSATTATGLTSEPVPDVVGMHTISINRPGNVVLAVILSQRAPYL